MGNQTNCLCQINCRCNGHLLEPPPVPLIEKRRGLSPGGRFPSSFIHQVVIITGLNKLYNRIFSPWRWPQMPSGRNTPTQTQKLKTQKFGPRTVSAMPPGPPVSKGMLKFCKSNKNICYRARGRLLLYQVKSRDFAVRWGCEPYTSRRCHRNAVCHKKRGMTSPSKRSFARDKLGSHKGLVYSRAISVCLHCMPTPSNVPISHCHIAQLTTDEILMSFDHFIPQLSLENARLSVLMISNGELK